MISRVIVISIAILAISVTEKEALPNDFVTKVTETTSTTTKESAVTFSTATTSINEASTDESSATEAFTNKFLMLIFEFFTTIYLFLNENFFTNEKEWLHNRYGEFVQK